MAGDDELERQVRMPAVNQAETRWLSLRLDDVKEIRQELRAIRREYGTRFDSIDRTPQAHDGRFDSTDAVLRSLHQMVGQVLERPPGEPGPTER